ncbi:sulfonate ABC transporter ATP-binding protein [Jeotgalibacillus proteolyticus]|uniref:Sulfonate ABC transporter ATP-binding protein n=2 Tax=Jeotgalibacillus proteolyticus TaxID=2082395 RepID=A0A2S5G7Z1_9BACL|nr:sulfonate ABC transporter ATP-binding protein [Jeotgalibacillus proteolyticus]
MTLLDLNDVSKRFITEKGITRALDDIELDVKKGEFITIIGPSGCGKSTLLKIIAGLDTEHEGEVLLDGDAVLGPSIDKGFIFQEPRLFPWLNVEKNISANLPVTKEVKEHVRELIKLVRLEGFETAYPKELSGGMAQRVAIARALLRNPKVLLLDEPFGALDAFTRAHMQEVLLDIWQKNKTTMIFVTHDIDEAIYLADRVVIMNARPGTIRKMIPVGVTHPRKKTNADFQKIRQQVLTEFEQVEHGKSLAVSHS